MTRGKVDSIKEFFRKGNYQGRVLEVLVYFASDKGEKSLPTIEEFILSEVVAATIEYLTGKEYLFTYHRSENGEESVVSAEHWEWKANEAMAEAVKQFGGKLNSPLKEALQEMTELIMHFDETGGRGYESPLYHYYKYQICQSWFVSIFSLPTEFVKKVERETISSLEPETIKHCAAIAKIMDKYIKRDLNLIKNRYHW
jgi:hypothetical protein